MKFKSTIQIGNAELEAIERGELKLQPGQWVQLDWLSKPSRFVGQRTKHCLTWMTHHPRNNEFSANRSAFKSIPAKGTQ